MHRLALWMGAPAAVLMAVSWFRACAVADLEFLLRLRAGFWGGVLGTIGYDIVRIPIHYLGLNPLTPIRFYGVWVTGAGETTITTDLAGIAYHFSNGLTFAWIYSLLFLRRHWLWGVAWGLALEGFAVGTVFGDVFALRHAPLTLVIAFSAHLFYGGPLGWICQKPETALGWFHPVFRRGGAWLSLLALAGVALWFPLAWPTATTPRHGPPQVTLSSRGLLPGMSDLPAGSAIRLVNETDSAQTVHWRLPDASGARRLTVHELAAGARLEVDVVEPGVHQILVPGKKWRSVFITVHDRSGYRPRPPAATPSAP